MALPIDETRPHLNGFSEFYEREIRGWLEAQESRRRKVVWGSALGLAATQPPLAYWLFRLWEAGSDNADWVLILMFVVGGVAISPYFTLKRDVKAHLFRKISGFFGLGRGYTGTVRVEDFARHHLIPTPVDWSHTDMLYGEHKGIRFALSEVDLFDGKRGDEERATIYHGLLIALDFPKPFSGRTVVLKDSGALGNWLMKPGQGFERVALEDPGFEGVFEVHGTDQIEARRILAPAFMERLASLAEFFGQASLQAAFADSMLRIAVNTRTDWFDPGGMVFRKVDHTERVVRMAQQISAVLEIVDILKLEQRVAADDRSSNPKPPARAADGPAAPRG